MIDAILVVKNNLDLFAKINFVLSIKNLKKNKINFTKILGEKRITYVYMAGEFCCVKKKAM